MKKKSFYDWKKMSQQELNYNNAFMISIFEDQILLSDWFSDFHSLVSPLNIRPKLELHLEGQLNGLNSVFLFGMIQDKQHQSSLEDLTYELIHASRDMSMIIKERAIYLCHAWKEKILSFKE